MTVTWGAITTYPNPSVMEEGDDMTGATGIMADGSLVIDTITTEKRIKLEWHGISATDSRNLYIQAITRTAAVMDMTNVGSINFGNVIPIPNTARRTPSGGAGSIVYDMSVEVRTE